MDPTLGPIQQCTHGEKNFIQTLYTDHHWTTMCSKSLKEVSMLLIIVVCMKNEMVQLFSKYSSKLQQVYTSALLLLSFKYKNRRESNIFFNKPF